MPRLMLLALCLFALTLVVPLFVWGHSQSWREAFAAWWWYARWMAALYIIGAVVWVGTSF